MSTRKIEPPKTINIANEIYEKWPILWKKCEVCGKEKHFESMFCREVYYWSCGSGAWLRWYYCKECCPTKTDAVVWIEMNDERYRIADEKILKGDRL